MIKNMKSIEYFWKQDADDYHLELEESNGEGGGGWRKLHKEEFCNLPCVWNCIIIIIIIIIIMQEKEMSWMRHVALEGEMNRAGLVETAEVKRPLSDF
jgi:hypothetical protein